jgi:tRNA A37 threonylcarbamoyladenosine modification protein TsaB
MNAQRREVFAALYRIGAPQPFAPDRIAALGPPLVDAPAAVLERWRGKGTVPAVIVGDGAEVYRAAIGTAAEVRPAPPLAATIGRMAVHGAGAPVDPARVQPLYVRRPDAELARERRP